MRSSLSRLILSLGISLGLGVLPAQAQVSDRQVGALVEALRQAAPQTGTEDDGLYSDWQIKPENIPRWSRSCIGRELSPTEFSASPATARTVLVCVMRDVLSEQYEGRRDNESLAVRRAASWWMTGDPSQYNNGSTADYTQRVLGFYQQQLAAASSSSPSRPAPAQTPPAQTPPAQAAPAQPTTSIFDRYMNAGYTATQTRDYPTALLYFRRALDERPNDSFAQQAIRNVEGYINRQATPEAAPDAAPEPTPAPEQ
jgi:hypothetical protein